MTASRLDGRLCASAVENSLKIEVQNCKDSGVNPHLAVVIVGDDPASHVYVNNKVKACERLGIISTHISLPSDTTESELVNEIERLNADDLIHGILIQSPLPKHMDEEGITDLISPSKDVDGFHPVNLGRLVQGRTDGMLPCTPAGVIEMLKWANIETEGKNAVILGRSRIVGMPMSLLLAAKGCDSTVTITHSRTQNLAEVCKQADILVAAVGIPELVKKSWVKQDAVVVDVGINRVEDLSIERGWRLAGDVDPDVAEVASWLSPVPGGVGPMTIAMLMKNTINAAKSTI